MLIYVYQFNTIQVALVRIYSERYHTVYGVWYSTVAYDPVTIIGRYGYHLLQQPDRMRGALCVESSLTSVLKPVTSSISSRARILDPRTDAYIAGSIS